MLCNYGKINVMKSCAKIFNKFSEVDAVVLITSANTFYVSGYESSFAIVILSAKGGFYLTDNRYIEEAKVFLLDKMECVVVNYRDAYLKVNEILNSIGAVKIGFENTSITYDCYQKLSGALLGKILTGIEDELLAIRAVKNKAELNSIKKAGEINDLAFKNLLSKIKNDITEKEVAYELEYNMKKLGADGIAFDTIVAFGDNTSKPHAHLSSRKLEKGMPVTIDFGCKYDGYCSDITRTFSFGEPSEKFIKVYNIVANANFNGLNTIKAGVSAQEIDRACRDYIKSFDMDKYFIHGTGHGVGIDIHEAPTINANSLEVLKENMVITVEPGIYIEGFAGVRIEDLVIVTTDGCEIISKTDKKLMIL